MTGVSCGNGASVYLKLNFKHIPRFILTVFLPLWPVSSAFSAPPPNDDFSQATIITDINESYTGTTVEATTETGEPSYAYENFNSVWWTWVATETSSQD